MLAVVFRRKRGTKRYAYCIQLAYDEAATMFQRNPHISHTLDLDQVMDLRILDLLSSNIVEHPVQKVDMLTQSMVLRYTVRQRDLSSDIKDRSHDLKLSHMESIDCC